MNTSIFFFLVMDAIATYHNVELRPTIEDINTSQTSPSKYSTHMIYNAKGTSPPTTTFLHSVSGKPTIAYTTTVEPLSSNIYERRGAHSNGGEGGSDANPPVFMPDAHSVPNPIENVSHWISKSKFFQQAE